LATSFAIADFARAALEIRSVFLHHRHVLWPVTAAISKTLQPASASIFAVVIVLRFPLGLVMLAALLGLSFHHALAVGAVGRGGVAGAHGRAAVLSVDAG
jgi:hypothetical protein